MARIPRIVIPNIPHHVTQRGNRRQLTFFEEDDYKCYLDFLYSSCKVYGVRIWAYCLMPNHIHLIAVPQNESSLRLALGDCHERYSKMINVRFGWKGYLWQGRFKSFPMDEEHMFNAARYIEMNPLRARMVNSPQEYQWSSARAHLGLTVDKFVDVAPLLERYGNWSEYLQIQLDQTFLDLIRSHSRTGRPLGSNEFVGMLESQTGRTLHPKKRGPKPRPVEFR